MNSKTQKRTATRHVEFLTWLSNIGIAMAAVAWCGAAQASSEAFTIDPDHTYPSFEADHFGISVWRGKMNKTTGKVILDRIGHSGSTSLVIDLKSIDFGQDKLNEWAIGPEFFDTAKYPEATYKGEFTHFVKGVPTQVSGTLTLHGVTKDIPLKINSFACKQHPMLKREWCGADVSASFQRDDFGLDVGKAYGFKMKVLLRIQVEAVKDEGKP